MTFFTMEPYFRQHGTFRHGLKLRGAAFDDILELNRKIEQESSGRGSGFGWAQECLTSLLIIQLCRAHVAAFGNDMVMQQGEHPHIKAVITAMALVTGKQAVGVTLDDLAQAAGLERSHFCRVFRKVTGMTPMEFVRYEIIKKARRLLFESSLNISEIAMELGYCDSAHFCKNFRAATGRNPSELRQHRF